MRVIGQNFSFRRGRKDDKDRPAMSLVESSVLLAHEDFVGLSDEVSSKMLTNYPKILPHNLLVGKVQNLFTDDLVLLMAFAGDQDHVSRLGLG